MTEQEKENALLEKIKTGVAEKFDKLVSENPSFKGLEDLKKQVGEAASKADLQKANDAIEEVGLKLKAISEDAGKKNVSKSFAEQVYDGLVALKAAEKLAGLKDRKNGSFESFTVKAAGTMTTANVDAVGTNGLSMLLNQFEPGITPIPRSQPFFAQLLNIGRTTGNTVSYAEMKNPDGGAGMTGEGSAKTQADFDIVEAKADVKKVTAYIKTSKEALDDIAALQAEINSELITLVKNKLDAQLLSGDGTGNNLTGVTTAATAFAAGSFANAINAANNFDVLAVAVNQIMTAEVQSGEPAGFMPNYIVMNPTDVIKMKLTKDSNNQYIFPVSMPGISEVINVPVISNARMTVDKFLVGDFTKAQLRIREDVNIQIGYENDDFTKNLVTILAEMRAAAFVKSNHAKAFVYGDFSDAIAALETP